MSGVLGRAAEFFLAPAAAEPRVATAVVPPAVRAVVLGARPDAVPLAAALALSLRAAGRTRTAVVAVWDADGLVALHRGLASRPAAELAARLAARELAAVARGRLVWLQAPPEAAVAAEAVRRASGVVEGPLVTALTGARPAELDDLVAEHDLAIVVAAPETALARAALAGLDDRGIAATAREPLGRGIPRTLALAGLTGPRLDATRPAAVRHESER
jgi:hypothetical protein